MVFNMKLKSLISIERCLIVCGFVCLIGRCFIEIILFAVFQFCTIVEMFNTQLLVVRLVNYCATMQVSSEGFQLGVAFS